MMQKLTPALLSLCLILLSGCSTQPAAVQRLTCPPISPPASLLIKPEPLPLLETYQSNKSMPLTNLQERQAHADCGRQYRKEAANYSALIDWLNKTREASHGN